MPTNKHTVLLAEDDQFLQRMYISKLEKAGFNVLSAKDGKQALDILQSKEVDVALLDILMPRKDGFEVLKEIRADSKLKSLPVIVLTNFNEVEDIKKAKVLGANEYMVKANFLPSEVISVIKKYIK